MRSYVEVPSVKLERVKFGKWSPRLLNLNEVALCCYVLDTRGGSSTEELQHEGSTMEISILTSAIKHVRMCDHAGKVSILPSPYACLSHLCLLQMHGTGFTVRFAEGGYVKTIQFYSEEAQQWVEAITLLQSTK